ncbi:hypothetical protein V6N13_015764 [Hibiscus sabdariffa]|uniref:Uncharacterized protein n=1 Tax=Hibiscus sabdariffa TaxID=183260 RepID=A0ABR2CWM7_9ROSI
MQLVEDDVSARQSTVSCWGVRSSDHPIPMYYYGRRHTSHRRLLLPLSELVLEALKRRPLLNLSLSTSTTVSRRKQLSRTTDSTGADASRLQGRVPATVTGGASGADEPFRTDPDRRRLVWWRLERRRQ